MSVKVSKKDIKNTYSVICTGYCSMQYLLKGIEDIGYYIGYSSNSNGWNCDYYIIRLINNSKNICISTGYNPVHDIKYNPSAIEDAEKKAKLIYEKYNYDIATKKINKLLIKIVEKIMEA